jgi:hypothetical protein
VDFHAEKYFPTDDSGDGFDNIGEVLSVSPVLVEEYLSAAERIARWAISTELPPKPVVDEYHQRDRKIRRVDPSTIEAIHRVEFAGEYTVRFGLPGERAPAGKPVTLNLWMDGKLLASKQIETRPSGLVYFDPYSEEEVKVYLPVGDHVFRVTTNDDFVKTLARAISTTTRRTNSELDRLHQAVCDCGKGERSVCLLRSDSGRACVGRILSLRSAASASVRGIRHHYCVFGHKGEGRSKPGLGRIRRAGFAVSFSSSDANP